MERLWKPVRRIAAASTLVVLGGCALVQEKEPVQPAPTIPAFIDCAYEASPDGGKTTIIIDQCNAAEGDPTADNPVLAKSVDDYVVLDAIEPVVPLGIEVSEISSEAAQPGLSTREVASDLMVLTGASMIAVGGVMLVGQRRQY